ncbi:MAG: TolC family protein [Bacteroidia bacterium]
MKPNFILAQTNIKDTVVLTFDEFYNRFLRFHPMAKRANLLPAIAKQELRTARGNFDPVLSGELNGKQTKGAEMFQYLDPQIKIPTLIGVDIKAGMEQTNGVLVNPERAKLNEQTGRPSNVNYQMFYGGFSLPVFRGLITDARRTQLNLAKVLVNMNEAEQIKELNKLFLNAAKDYWNWQQSYQNFLLMQLNRDFAAARFDFVKNRILLGEEKPIDSVEALIEFQRRDVMLINAQLEFLNAGIELSNYLWDENENPLNLAQNVVPSDVGSNIVTITTDSLNALVAFTQNYHPEINKLSLKVRQYSFERKLALENLKPQLNLEYYPFQTFTNGNEDVVNGIFTNNYKYGVTFYSSLLLRKERGKLGSTTLKLKQSEYDLKQGRKEIVNNVLATYNDLNTLEQLLKIQIKLVENNRILRDGEEFRFENGESSLFLVNQRERALIESQSKLVELQAKYAKAKYMLQWATGVTLFY